MPDFDWIGELRHKITIEAVTEVQDENGNITNEWATFLEDWAQVEPLTGRELAQAKQIDASVDHRVRMRYREGIRPKMRVIFFPTPGGSNRTFDIRVVANLKYRNARLELICTELEV